MCESGGFNFRRCCLSFAGRNASLRGMDAPHSVPLKASTCGRCKELTVTIAQCQWTECIWRSNNSSIVIDVRRFGYKDRSAYSKMFRNSSSFQQVLVGIEEELGAQTARTLTIRNSIGARIRIFLQRNGLVELGMIDRPAGIDRGFFEHAASCLRTGRVSDLLREPRKIFLQYSQSLLPGVSSSSKGWPSSSVTALRHSTGFLARQARCPDLHREAPCPSRSVSKGDLLSPLLAPLNFHELGSQ